MATLQSGIKFAGVCMSQLSLFESTSQYKALKRAPPSNYASKTLIAIENVCTVRHTLPSVLPSYSFLLLLASVSGAAKNNFPLVCIQSAHRSLLVPVHHQDSNYNLDKVCGCCFLFIFWRPAD